MHTTYQARHFEPGYEWRAHHNGDFSGTVILTKAKGRKVVEFEVPFDFLAQLVGQAMIDRKTWELESADPFAFIGWPEPKSEEDEE